MKSYHICPLVWLISLSTEFSSGVLLRSCLGLRLRLCAGCTALLGLECDGLHSRPGPPQFPPPWGSSSPPQSVCSLSFHLRLFPAPARLLSHLSVLPTSHPSPALFLRDLRSFPSPITVQEIPGSAVPEAGRGPEGEALCQRAVQGQKGFIRPEVRPSETLRHFLKSKEKLPQEESRWSPQTSACIGVTPWAG